MISLAHARSFQAVKNQLEVQFRTAQLIHSRTWQGVDVSKQPAAQMLELLNVNIHVPAMPRTIEYLANDLVGSVNLPWAENHFLERVGGLPINPGVEWENWPGAHSAEKFLNPAGQFNHNYMERYWPRIAGLSMKASRTGDEFKEGYSSWENHMCQANQVTGPNFGIRHEYGDLMDLVDLLRIDPETRQAYLPIFFPEDTGIGDGGRKPCTLGYHFILRAGEFHVYYPMRSCDFHNHWGDDVYMTVRLAMWILNQLRDREAWAGVKLGSFIMHCTSLHMFINDFHKMQGR